MLSDDDQWDAYDVSQDGEDYLGDWPEKVVYIYLCLVYRNA